MVHRPQLKDTHCLKGGKQYTMGVEGPAQGFAVSGFPCTRRLAHGTCLLETGFSQCKWLQTPLGLTLWAPTTRVPGQKIWGQLAPMLQPCFDSSTAHPAMPHRASHKQTGSKGPALVGAPARSGGHSVRAHSSHSQAGGRWRSSAASYHIFISERDKSRLVFQSQECFKPFSYTSLLGVLCTSARFPSSPPGAAE